HWRPPPSGGAGDPLADCDRHLAAPCRSSGGQIHPHDFATTLGTNVTLGNAMSVIDPHTDVGKRPPPWDEYWTFGWLFLVQLLYWILALILAVVFKVDYQSGGGLVAIVLYAVQIGAVTLLAQLAHWPAKEYLSLVRPNGRDTVIAIALVAL